jgi:hypothetical protein
MRSPVDEPQDQAERDAHEKRRRNRDIKTKTIALDVDISRQAPEAKLC